MEARISPLVAIVRAALLTRTHLALESATLRQRLTICQRTQKRVRLRGQDRVLRVALRRFWSG